MQVAPRREASMIQVRTRTSQLRTALDVVSTAAVIVVASVLYLTLRVTDSGEELHAGASDPFAALRETVSSRHNRCNPSWPAMRTFVCVTVECARHTQLVDTIPENHRRSAAR
jgi:hypothetical protein